MRDFLFFFESFFKNLPALLLILFFLLLIGIVIMLIVLRVPKIKILKVSAWLALVEFVFMIILATVFFRPISQDSHAELIPLWSYARIIEGDMHLLRENILNTLLFVPVGVLLCILTRGERYVISTVFVFSLSLGIEIMQLYFKRGLFEFDDILHNTLGGIIGYVMAFMILHLKK